MNAPEAPLDLASRMLAAQLNPYSSCGVTAALKDCQILAAEVVRLTEDAARYRWRPIAEMHEDCGPCAVMDIHDAGGVSIAHVCEFDFDPGQWTHFSQIAPLTTKQAKAMIADMEAPAIDAARKESR